MSDVFYPSNLILARESRGLTQYELSNILNITQGKLSKIEQGFLNIKEDLLIEVSKKLNYPLDFFYNKIEQYTDLSFYRKKQSLTLKHLNEIEAKKNIITFQIMKLFKSIELEYSEIPFMDLDDYESPESIANMLRAIWKVPKGPIENLVKLIERNGIIVILFNFKSKKIDGFTLNTCSPPIIFLNNSYSGDRQRFTLAHELGHLIMHKYPSNTKEQEEEAHNFASEFLMPSSEIKYQLEKINMNRLFELKEYWKVSMQSIIMKAFKLELITPTMKKNLFIYFGKKGYRTNEPIDIPKEIPNLLTKIIEFYEKTLGYNMNELCELLMINDNEFIEMFNLKAPSTKLKSKFNNAI